MKIRVLVKQEESESIAVIDSKNYKAGLHFHLSGREFTSEEVETFTDKVEEVVTKKKK
jgi:hypothetical protein